MKRVKLVVEEIYKVEREITLYMNNQQYQDWINNNHSPVEGLLRKSHNIKDFINRTRTMNESGEEKGFSYFKLSDYENDLRHKENIGFDVVYINSGSE